MDKRSTQLQIKFNEPIACEPSQCKQRKGGKTNLFKDISEMKWGKTLSESFSNFGFGIHCAYVKLNWVYKQIENRRRRCCCCCSHSSADFSIQMFLRNVVFLFIIYYCRGYSFPAFWRRWRIIYMPQNILIICMRHVFIWTTDSNWSHSSMNNIAV